jgi:hypothetical protein
MSTDFDFSGVSVEDAPPLFNEPMIGLPPQDIPTPKPERATARDILGLNTDDEPPKPRPRRGALKRDIQDFYTQAAFMVYIFDPTCAQAVAESAEKAAEAWEKLAFENPAIMRALQRMMEVGAWGGLIAAHAPIALAVFAHHAPNARILSLVPHDENDNEGASADDSSGAQ